MIIRVQKRETPYVVIDKTGLNDKRLTFKARGILAYLLAKPDDWEVIVQELINASPEGRTAIYSGLKELEKYGYMRKRVQRGKDGKFTGWDYDVIENPSIIPDSGFPNTEKPQVEKPNTENQPLLNNDLLLSNENTNNYSSQVPATPTKLPKIFPKESKEYKLAALLRKRILDNLPTAKVPPDNEEGLRKWAYEIDLMIRRDGRNPADIYQVIEWCQADSFWRSNILSTTKLRKQFDRLTLQMQERGGIRHKTNRNPDRTISSLIIRADEGGTHQNLSGVP